MPLESARRFWTQNSRLRRAASAEKEPARHKKPDCTFMQSGSSPGVARKSRPCASIEAYGRACAKVSEKIDYDEKNREGMAAMQMLHCTILTIGLYLRVGRSNRGLDHGVLYRNVRPAAAAGTSALSLGTGVAAFDEQCRPRRHRHQARRFSARRPRNVHSLDASREMSRTDPGHLEMPAPQRDPKNVALPSGTPLWRRMS